MIEHESFNMSSIKTREQLISASNRALDKLCEQFDKAFREIKESSAIAKKCALEMKETLLEKNEQKYSVLCDEALEIEKEFCVNEKDHGKLYKRLQAIPNDLCFIDFEVDFISWLFETFYIVEII